MNWMEREKEELSDSDHSMDSQSIDPADRRKISNFFPLGRDPLNTCELVIRDSTKLGLTKLYD